MAQAFKDNNIVSFKTLGDVYFGCDYVSGSNISPNPVQTHPMVPISGAQIFAFMGLYVRSYEIWATKVGIDYTVVRDAFANAFSGPTPIFTSEMQEVLLGDYYPTNDMIGLSNFAAMMVPLTYALQGLLEVDLISFNINAFNTTVEKMMSVLENNTAYTAENNSLAIDEWISPILTMLFQNFGIDGSDLGLGIEGDVVESHIHYADIIRGGVFGSLDDSIRNMGVLGDSLPISFSDIALGWADKYSENVIEVFDINDGLELLAAIAQGIPETCEKYPKLLSYHFECENPMHDFSIMLPMGEDKLLSEDYPAIDVRDYVPEQFWGILEALSAIYKTDELPRCMLVIDDAIVFVTSNRAYFYGLVNMGWTNFQFLFENMLGMNMEDLDPDFMSSIMSIFLMLTLLGLHIGEELPEEDNILDSDVTGSTGIGSTQDGVGTTTRPDSTSNSINYEYEAVKFMNTHPGIFCVDADQGLDGIEHFYVHFHTQRNMATSRQHVYIYGLGIEHPYTIDGVSYDDGGDALYSLLLEKKADGGQYVYYGAEHTPYKPVPPYYWHPSEWECSDGIYTSYPGNNYTNYKQGHRDTDGACTLDEFFSVVRTETEWYSY